MSRTIAGRDRVAAATLALLLQSGFIAAFLHAFSTQAPPRQLERELTFFLPRLLPKPAPVQPPARATSPPLNVPVIAPPILSIAPAPTAAPNAAILQSLGHSLFGCAPENYTNLTPQQRALCPRLGEGVAIQNAPPLEDLPSQVKDNPYWANALAHKKSPLLFPGASPDGGLNLLTIHSDGTVSGLAPAIINGSITDTENWPTYVDPSQFMPRPPLQDGKPGQNAGADPQ